MSRRRWLAQIAAVVALVLGGRMALRYIDYQASEAERAADASIDVARLETLAIAACRCTRANGETRKQACWEEYKAAAPRVKTVVYGTACAPVSTETECFETSDGETCVITGYNVNGGTEKTLNRNLCTPQEAQAVEYAYQQAWLGPDGKEPDPKDSADWQASDKRGQAAIDAVLKRIMVGKKVAPAGPVSGGCNG